MRLARLVTIAGAVGIAGVIAAAPAGATAWTSLQTGTTDAISAVAYRSASRLVFTTATGKIFRLTPEGVRPSAVADVPLRDVALSPDGTASVAVGDRGAVFHSTDGGATWSVSSASEYVHNGSDCPGSADTPAPLVGLTDDLFSAQFADANTVYVTGRGGDVLRSTDRGASFAEVNFDGRGNCVAPIPAGGRQLTDSAWSGPGKGTLVWNAFGILQSTTDGLGTSLRIEGGLNGYEGRVHLAVDAADPSRMWEVGTGQYSPDFVSSRDGGHTWTEVRATQGAMEDVSTAGGTVIAVGAGGRILTSVDGQGFSDTPAPAPRGATGWHAIDLYDAAHAAVGGDGGSLVVTASANEPRSSSSAPMPGSFLDVEGQRVQLLAPGAGSCIGSRLPLKIKISTRRIRRSGTRLRIRKAVFYVDGRRRVVDRRAPFQARVSTRGLRRGVHRLASRITVLLTRAGRTRRITRTLKGRFSLC